MNGHLLATLSFCLTILPMIAQEDPYLWLEEVDGDKALEFVERHNSKTFSKFQSQDIYESIYNKSLEIYNSDDRIAYPTLYGDFVYNFWKDKEHVRGIWRRAAIDNYLAGNPDWETLLDIDALSEEDEVMWVYKGASGLFPDYDRFLVSLSKGGGDATVTREFDINTKSFVDGGFQLDEAKGGAYFVDRNTVIVSTNFGENTLTSSGYPRQAKLWKRGTSLNDAQLIFEGETDDVGSWGFVLRDGDKKYITVTRAITIFSKEHYVWRDGNLIKIEIPDDCDIQAILNDQLVIQLKSDWTVHGVTYPLGALVSLFVPDLLSGRHTVRLVFSPDDETSISQVASTKHKLLVNELKNVKNELYIYSFRDDKWHKEKVHAPDYGTISIMAADDFSDQYFFVYTNFLTPSTLYVANAEDNTFSKFKSLPAFFDGSKYEVNQYRARSIDGTEVPYFVVSAKDMKANGQNPTFIFAYGGFEVAYKPNYSATVGTAWLDNGGVYVLANIRGGGEFGPRWHQAALKEKRQNAFYDLYAVSEDLISRKITSPEHLGVYGGSNGGLLVGVAFTQRPDLYNAVVCAVPLLDMQRYHKLLAGASWMGEYGNPDIPEEWEYISKYSPYHNLKMGVDYPEVFFYTSTRDDRVHPGHARKMVAKMNDMGYHVYYYENTEGGHAAATTNEQSARLAALQYTYLLMKLK